ncbi:hypothetical protein ABMA28_011128 [Loxostege sticticalis]|uniref:Uncharacterized protein n=1 Tax=Loxostege sticticalis TaxID=481309 RepID=A0ABD0S693_LOXSC
MKSIALIVIFAQVAVFQVVASPQLLVQPNSVANNLADTLSLLTVSSLLAESLPLGYPNVLSLPVASPVLGGCGCGGYNYPLYL